MKAYTEKPAKKKQVPKQEPTKKAESKKAKK